MLLQPARENSAAMKSAAEKKSDAANGRVTNAGGSNGRAANGGMPTAVRRVGVVAELRGARKIGRRVCKE